MQASTSLLVCSGNCTEGFAWKCFIFDYLLCMGYSSYDVLLLVVLIIAEVKDGAAKVFTNQLGLILSKV